MCEQNNDKTVHCLIIIYCQYYIAGAYIIALKVSFEVGEGAL